MSLNFGGNCPTFPKWMHHFLIPPAVQGSNCSTSSPTLATICLFDHSHPRRCGVAVRCFFLISQKHLKIESVDGKIWIAGFSGGQRLSGTGGGAFAVETESRLPLQVPTAFISSPPLLKGLESSAGNTHVSPDEVCKHNESSSFGLAGILLLTRK